MLCKFYSSAHNTRKGCQIFKIYTFTTIFVETVLEIDFIEIFFEQFWKFNLSSHNLRKSCQIFKKYDSEVKYFHYAMQLCSFVQSRKHFSYKFT